MILGVTWQIGMIKSRLCPCLRSPNASGWWHTAPTHKVTWLFNHVVLWDVRSYDKLNTWFLHLQKIYEHQTRQGGDLLWEAPSLKTTLPQIFHVTNWQNYILWLLNLAGCWLLGEVQNENAYVVTDLLCTYYLLRI